ncbi:polyisoprenoid diphosphate/phosphate phosphohydrolase PLPP6 [Dermatophagoides farinae]|uniref:Presqualene diphosphate phosphatase-like protein n=1 Tax=Dermatophagoides farinae TaxID=6954 RepID=A0A922KX00_DERFA|nr:phospholipid phosphatase 6-like [Dermatophagoides farinae]KAH7644288.1 presqualene diphosphate phosphatase-like protein [Dermatophagoides farinae]KAH9493795.1 hypothetical protein DERF_014524 [Dermatophagoides farinae]
MLKNVQENLAIFDEKLSYQCYRLGQRTLNIKKRYLQSLEYSCHGIPWLSLITLFTFTSSDNDFWLDLLIGLLIDIVYIALAKASCRRRRPQYAPQADNTWITVDKLSFPSGHASRSIYVALILSNRFSYLSIILWPWALAVTISRVLYGRHFIGDILAGTIIGYFNYVTRNFPIQQFIKWFLVTMVYETINDNY